MVCPPLPVSWSSIRIVLPRVDNLRLVYKEVYSYIIIGYKDTPAKHSICEIFKHLKKIFNNE